MSALSRQIATARAGVAQRSRDAIVDWLAARRPSPAPRHAAAGGSSVASRRYEVKYLVETRRLPELRRALDGFFRLDAHAEPANGYHNYSIYFDTPDDRFYREKIEGDLSRIKPRIRLYKQALDAAPVSCFLEFKGRIGGTVSKRRAEIDLDTAKRLIAGRCPAPDTGGNDAEPLLGEFQYRVNRYSLRPRVTVLYHRTPLVGAFYPGVRLTFDRAISCSQAVGVALPSQAFRAAVPANWTVMELKYNDVVPAPLLRRFNALELTGKAISKYAICVESVFGLQRHYSPAPRFATGEYGLDL